MLLILLFVLGWSLYNLPVLAAGVRDLRRNRRKSSGKSFNGKDLPTFSIIVPVKNEERVVGRLLNALLRLNYPRDKVEVIVVEDGSMDGTVDICKKYEEESHGVVKFLHKPFSNGKPSALNYGVKHAKGEIIGVFDADNVPERSVLMNVCRHYEDSEVAGVQGRTLSINSEENMLSKFISYEEAVWCEAYLRGKDVLDLFVYLKGSCMFIRRDVLEKLGGFDEKALSEDMEISARLTEKGYKIRYAPDVRSWQETPSNLKQLFTQRTRWYRGTMEVAFKYGKLMAKPNRRSLDAELTLIGPFILIASLISYFLAFYASFATFGFGAFLRFLMQFSVIGTSIILTLCGLALAYATEPRRLSNLLWLPFIYFYWSLQAFIASYALSLVCLRRPRKWIKTEKKGTMTRAVAG